MPSKKRSRHKRREIIREQAMGPVIPNRKDYKKLKYAHEKSGVLKIGVVTHKIFDLQVAGEYRFEVRCNIRSPEHVAWTPQYVCEGGPKKYIHLYRGYETHRMCGVFPLRGSTVMDSEPFDKLPVRCTSVYHIERQSAQATPRCQVTQAPQESGRFQVHVSTYLAHLGQSRQCTIWSEMCSEQVERHTDSGQVPTLAYRVRYGHYHTHT